MHCAIHTAQQANAAVLALQRLTEICLPGNLHAHCDLQLRWQLSLSAQMPRNLLNCHI